MRELRRSTDRKLLGVAAGCAEYFETDVTLMRLIWLLVCLAAPPMVLVYLVLGVALPIDDARSPQRSGRLTKSYDRWLAGVAAGLAEYLDLDPLLIRLLFLVSVCAGGLGLFIYLVLVVLMPQPPYLYTPPMQPGQP